MTTPTKPTKNQDFQRLAEIRVNNLLDKIRILGHLSNKSAYDFTREEIDLIFSEIDKKIAECREKFKTKPKVKTEKFAFDKMRADAIDRMLTIGIAEEEKALMNERLIPRI